MYIDDNYLEKIARKVHDEFADVDWRDLTVSAKQYYKDFMYDILMDAVEDLCDEDLDDSDDDMDDDYD